MKARVVTNKEIKIAEEIAKQVYMPRILKIVCYILNLNFKISRDKLSTIMQALTEECQDLERNEAYWHSIDRKLHHIGIEFQDEDYDEREARAKELQNAQRKRR